MWIEQIKNSKGIRFKYTERFLNPINKKMIKMSVTLNSNTKRVQKVAMEMLQEKFNSKYIDAEKQLAQKIQHLTFYNVADEWLEYTRPTVKLTTHINHVNYVNRIKKAIPADLFFLNFSPAMAENIYHQLYYVENLSYGYCKSILITIKSIMRYAKKANYYYDISNFEEIAGKRRPMTPAELDKTFNKFLDKNELNSCLKQLKELNPRIALAMEFIALTGLRCGELLALRVKDYYRDKNYINVNGTIITKSANDENKRGTPKNIYSCRDVYLNERAKQILDKFILQNKQSALWDYKTYKDKGYIFTTKTGYPYDLSYINRLLRKIDIPNKHISSHIFRHTHISLLAELDTPLKAIMQRVGHHNPNTTLQIYTHVTETMKIELQNKLKALNF